MVTVLKNTTKLVSDVPFPALTVCGSGLHMNNVEKKLVQDFRDWRSLHKKTKVDREEIKKYMKEFMETRFQIKPTEPSVNILDILDMMIAPDADASVAANGVRENEIACRKQSSAGLYDASGCKPCSDDRFSLPDSQFGIGTKCLYVSTDTATQENAVTACQSLGAMLATINASADDAWVARQIPPSETSFSGSIWIGLKDITREGGPQATWVWQDGTPLSNPYSNWWIRVPDDDYEPNGDGACVALAGNDPNGRRWNDIGCSGEFRYACSMEPGSCDTDEVVEEIL